MDTQLVTKKLFNFCKEKYPKAKDVLSSIFEFIETEIQTEVTL